MAVRRSAKALRAWQNRNRYNERSGLTVANSWWGLHNQVKKRAKGMCESCKVKPGTEPHHIVPLARGRANTPANIIYLCESSHNRSEERRVGKRRSSRWGR